MISSMTAFARNEADTPSGELIWELRTVNHRYLDISLRLPEELRVLETRARETIGKKLSRGKVDALLRLQRKEAGEGDLDLNEPLVDRLSKLTSRVEHHAWNISGLRMIDILRWPGVISAPAIDTEALSGEAIDLLQRTLDEVQANRQREGQRIAEMISSRLEEMRKSSAEVPAIRQEVIARFRERLEEKLATIKDDLDPARLEAEIVMFIQKSDVEEEIDRLQSHLTEIGNVLQRSEPVGRRLDFLMQELNREANTLGSKATDIRLTNISVELKVLIEQMREQVQNLE